MFPLRDTNHSIRVPVVTWTLIGINVLVYLYESSLSPAALDRLIGLLGMVPARLTPEQILFNPLVLFTLLTHMFLHAGWAHILGNMWTLFIFGDNVEDRMGPARYLVFYLLGGLVAALSQLLIDPNSQLPSVGASGAIAGVLGAYFLMFPRSRVTTLILLIFIPWFVDIPAILYLGFWFVSQLFSGLTTLGVPGGVEVGGVAWWAHIGGFLFGMLFHRLFIQPRHPVYNRQYPDEYWPW